MDYNINAGIGTERDSDSVGADLLAYEIGCQACSYKLVHIFKLLSTIQFRYDGNSVDVQE